MGQVWQRSNSASVTLRNIPLDGSQLPCVTIGDMNALAEYMEKRDLRDAEMAETLGISRSYVTQLRNGRAPSIAQALKIHATLKIKLGPIADTPDSEIEALERAMKRAA